MNTLHWSWKKKFIIYEKIQGDKFSAIENDYTFQNRTIFIDF